MAEEDAMGMVTMPQNKNILESRQQIGLNREQKQNSENSSFRHPDKLNFGMFGSPIVYSFPSFWIDK